MAILGLGDYLCEACKWFDTDGNDGNHPYCRRQSYVDTPPCIAVRLGDECPFGYEFGVPSGYPVSKEDNERRAYEIKAILENRGGQMKLCPYCHNPLSDVDVNQLQDENAKLRELIADCMLMPGPYGEKYGIEPNFIVCSNHWGNRARDLGIEV